MIYFWDYDVISLLKQQLITHVIVNDIILVWWYFIYNSNTKKKKKMHPYLDIAKYGSILFKLNIFQNCDLKIVLTGFNYLLEVIRDI